MVWSPLAGGFLSGKYTRANPKGDAGARLASFEFLPHDKERGYNLIDLLQSIAKKHGSGPAQVSLAWLLTRPAVSSLLVGAASVKQLEENLGAADLKLDADDLAQLDTATKPTPVYPNWFTARVADGKAHEALGIPLGAPPVR
jgi:aryl-alcohol dehydrogenase-like predicted oxidoreductase